MVKKTREEVILVVDDSAETLEVLQRSIQLMGFEVFSCESVEEAKKILDDNHIDLVITDYHMPFVGGLDLIRHVRGNYRNAEVIMITGYASVEGAVEAIKAGAEEYLAKPFTDEELEQAIENSIEKLNSRIAYRTSPTEDLAKQYGLLGETDRMARVTGAIKKAASNSNPVLISGEAGTGKELAARIIHYESERSGKPFIIVNCQEIPESKIEGEIFGYRLSDGEKLSSKEKEPAATDETFRAGFLELAGEGTLFFSEISETPLAVQVKLLSVLTGGEFTPVCNNKTKKTSCRIIASSSRDLLELAGKGRFREDLFFRLNMTSLNLPPLRERENDILLLCNHYLSKACLEKGQSSVPGFSERASNALLRHAWTGNMTELKSMMWELAGKVSAELIEVADLPYFLRYNLAEDKRLDKTLQEVEKDYIKEVLSKYSGNKTKAAELLGIDRKTLRDKLNRQV
jgi:two-component system, NtrC family, response regulator HydG